MSSLGCKVEWREADASLVDAGAHSKKQRRGIRVPTRCAHAQRRHRVVAEFWDVSRGIYVSAMLNNEARDVMEPAQPDLVHQLRSHMHSRGRETEGRVEDAQHGLDGRHSDRWTGRAMSRKRLCEL